MILSWNTTVEGVEYRANGEQHFYVVRTYNGGGTWNARQQPNMNQVTNSIWYDGPNAMEQGKSICQAWEDEASGD